MWKLWVNEKTLQMNNEVWRRLELEGHKLLSSKEINLKI